LLKRLIDPLDDLARVIAQGPGARDAKTVLDAVEVVDKKMMKALADAGLEVLNPVGAPFDPEKHEAVSTAPAASPEEDHTVAQVFQPGYVFHGQLLRPARVVVKQWNG
jgi:molecular chaperone GrpE